MNYPKHVAIIPDGNRTWAKREGKSVKEGYLTSYQRGIEIMKYIFSETSIEVFTLRGLSTENANKRSKEELDLLMNLYKIVDDSELNDFLEKNKINFRRVGNEELIASYDFVNYLKSQMEKHNYPDSNKFFVICIAYGGRDEIIRGIKKLANKDFDFSQINEKILSDNLDFGDLANVELVIRTKGELAKRTSGFMNWRIGYSELYFSEKLCPEFGVEDFKKSLEWFDKIIEFRNFGK